MMESPIPLVLLLWCWLLPFAFREFRGSRSLAASVMLTVSLHAAVAVFNAAGGSTPGSEADARDFHERAAREAAMDGAKFGIGSGFYNWLLVTLYRAVGADLLAGEAISVLAFSMSCVVLVKLAHLLGAGHRAAAILLLFGATPPAVLFGSVLLRESLQTFWFMAACYAHARFLESGRPRHEVLAILAVIALAPLHTGLLAFAPLFLLLCAVTAFRWRFSISRQQGVALMAAVMVMLAWAVPALTRWAGAHALEAVTRGDMIEAAVKYRERFRERGASYEAQIDTSSPAAIAVSCLRLWFYYLACPFPWQVRGPADAYALLEAMGRIVLLWLALQTRRDDRRVRTFLLAAYLAMTLLFAMGTGNFGTSIRHHLVTNWILLVLALPRFLDILERHGARLRRVKQD